jgi:hypothetical protein
MCTTRDIKSAKAKPITRRRFEQRFCGALLLLIFATIVMVSVFRYFQEVIANTHGLDVAADVIERAFEAELPSYSAGAPARLSRA